MLQTTDAIEIAREALWLTLLIGAPMLLTALILGLVVSLFQALTQIQEMTLSFIPKIMGVFGVMILSMPFMIDTLKQFTLELFNRMTGQ
jgi:flagellar biosynthesis protein FliQ